MQCKIKQIVIVFYCQKQNELEGYIILKFNIVFSSRDFYEGDVLDKKKNKLMNIIKFLNK